MNHDQFAEYAGDPTGRSLRVDEVVVDVNAREFQMRGSLRVVEEEFELDLIHSGRSDASTPTGPVRQVLARALAFFRKSTRHADELPRVGGFIGASQFWRIRGVIENSLRFECRTVPTSHTLSLGDMPTKGARFRVSHISLLGESETHEETAARLNRLGAVDSSSSSSEAPEQGPLSGAGYEFHAVIPGTKPLWATSYSHTTWRNEYSGESSTKRRDMLIGGAKDVEFALIEREDDMHLHIRHTDFRSSLAPVRGVLLLPQGALSFSSACRWEPQWPLVIMLMRSGLRFAAFSRLSYRQRP